MEVEKDAANSTCTQAQTYAVKERVKSFDERCDDKTRKKLKLLLIIASVLAVLVELMLFRAYPNNYNAYYIAFCVIMACVLIAFNWEAFKRSKEGWFSAAVLITLLAATPIMWGKTDFSEFEETLRLINHLFAVPLVGLLIPTIIGRDFQRNSVRYFMTGYAMNLAPNWFKHFSMPFRLIGKTKAGDKRMLGKVLIGVAIGIPVFVVLILLLSQANEGLNRFIHDLPELPEPESGIYYYRKNDGRVEGLLQCMRDIAGVVPVPQDRGGEDRGTLEVRISLLLREFGVPANIKGYQYLRKAIQMAVETPESMSAVTKILYPDIAKCHGTTASCVERAMRSAIEVAWDRGNLECLHRYFGYTINPRAGRPTNSEFIATIADALGMEEKYPESTA